MAMKSVEVITELEQDKVYSGLYGSSTVVLDNGFSFKVDKDVRGFDYPILATYSTDGTGRVIVYYLDHYPTEDVLKEHGATEVTGAEDKMLNKGLSLEQFDKLVNGDKVLLFDVDGYFTKVTCIGYSSSEVIQKVFQRGSNFFTIGLVELEKRFKLYPITLSSKDRFLEAKAYLEEKVKDINGDIEYLEKELGK